MSEYISNQLGYKANDKMLTVAVKQFKHYALEDADKFALEHMLTFKGYNGADYQKPQMGNKVLAIKWFRLRYNVGLKEAKDAVECHANWMQEEEQKKQGIAGNGASSLGELLRQKIDKEQTKETTDLYGYHQCVFRIIGRGDWNSCTDSVRDTIHSLYNNGNSSGFCATELGYRHDL